nr:MAG TPA: hypothetical protein [Caudoviricetes sp.]
MTTPQLHVLYTCSSAERHKPRNVNEKQETKSAGHRKR